MGQTIRAIYENGVLRPLEPLELTDRAEVSLVVRPGPAPAVPGSPRAFPTFETGPIERPQGIDDVRRALEAFP